MTNLVGDLVVEELARLTEEDRLVLIGYLVNTCSARKRKNLTFQLIQLGLNADFVSGLLQESNKAFKKRRHESSIKS